MRPALFVFTGLLLAAPAARAGSYVEEQPRLREGLELGIGLQAGDIGCRSLGNYCNGFTEAGGLNLSASYFPSPKLGITLDLWGMSHQESEFRFNHYVNTVGVKWRPVRYLTLSAGFGAAHASVEYEGVFKAQSVTEDAPAVLGTISLDLLGGCHWALSLEARVGRGFYRGDQDINTPDVVGQSNGLGVNLSFFRF